MTPPGPIVTGNRAAVEWWAVMGDPDWGPERADDSVTLPGCLILRFTDDGLCAALREYWNADFGRAVAAPPDWGSYGEGGRARKNKGRESILLATINL